MSMFKLRVSKTLSRSAVCSLALGPGISVFTEGALGSTPSKRPMLLAEAENDRLGKDEMGARREVRSLVGLVAVTRREMVRRADILKTAQSFYYSRVLRLAEGDSQERLGVSKTEEGNNVAIRVTGTR